MLWLPGILYVIMYNFVSGVNLPDKTASKYHILPISCIYLLDNNDTKTLTDLRLNCSSELFFSVYLSSR